MSERVVEDRIDLDRPVATEAQQIEQAAPVATGGDPAMLGLPTFIAGSIALGLALTGYLPAAGAAGILPIVIMSNGLGLLIATIWAIRLGQSAVACIFGTFTGFWLSYAVLLLGLGHNWFGLTPAASASPAVQAAAAGVIKDTVSTFLLSWVIVVAVLTLVMLRLPLAFTVLLALVDVALILVLLGNVNTNANLSKAGGWVVFAFVALGVYLFAGAASVATGGKPFGLGKPIAS